MDDKKTLIQPRLNVSCGFTITCPFCSRQSEIKSDELELDKLTCPNCAENLPLNNLVFLHSDGSPIEEEELLLAESDDMKSYGTSIPAILSHRGEVDDLNLAYSIGFQLMEKAEKYGIDSLSEKEKYFYAIYELDNEINNGGYLQYFDNSSGDLAYLILDALRSIGSNKALKITEEALDIYGRAPSKDKEDRMKEIARITKNYEDNLWEKCDSRFYDIEDENIGILLIEYVEANQNNFKL